VPPGAQERGRWLCPACPSPPLPRFGGEERPAARLNRLGAPAPASACPPGLTPGRC
jgi:hypothetical protein